MMVMRSFSFYYQHLENVSRSFSFCISQLTSPAKEWVALSYLLLRVADSIEDAKWQDLQTQSDSFAAFKSFLVQTPANDQFTKWLSSFPSQLPLGEKQLLCAVPLLLEEKDNLPESIKQSVIKTILQVVDGMHYFLNHYHMEGKIVFPSLVTTNQYCFFVAGLVGKLLSHIFTDLLSNFKWTASLLNQAFHFGFFLQKINLLKDKVDDETSGRYFISSENSLRESLVIHAHHSLAYVKSIPIIEGRPYRLFCAWSLFIGLASLKWLDKYGHRQKIKPRETYYLVNQINLLIDDNRALEKLFNSYLPGQYEEGSCYASESTKKIPNWFKKIYDGEMDSLTLFDLDIEV
ncbi:TPA: peptide ABC transporter substrate-binding protein [Legionella pneumophila]|nr:peptide ABC transporter substrate-binding protein [Legionella pneumophila]HAT9115259.1 peptide ABC transporter substrate-binding protein [Legionella pneumophila subsp. pneumophila]HAT7922447.1 peptide ABC transporter substrate-binding protein [Legionella pneumophila]HAT8309821.1 peptide ABC transporter substrate-binding protein [Legionella pneumophila]HAT8325045.1 peptide ABC transporter substrate-binding protein [Legionella pneumophila]